MARTPLETFNDEVVDLHRLFERMFNDGDADGRLIREFAARLDESFWIVDPRGQRRDRKTIVAAVARHVGGSAVSISVAAEDGVHHYGDLIVGSYVERHSLDGVVTERLATAGLLADQDAPSGWRWLFVHETWIDGPDELG